MHKNRERRLAELEQRLAEQRQRRVQRGYDAIWAQLSAAEAAAVAAAKARMVQPGYVPTAEDAAIEQRWNEAVRAAVPDGELLALRWAEWAVDWCKAVRNG
jgi:hypothetical protein